MLSHSRLIGKRLFSSGSARRFLLFGEAREWARQSGIANAKEWKQLGSSRPPNIPSNPQRTYEDDYVDLFDWLGQTPPPSRDPSAKEKIRTAESRENRCFRQIRQASGIAKLLGMAEAGANDFEFFRMPKHAVVDLLFRRRSSNDYGEWAALHVRTSRSLKNRAPTRACFTHMGRATENGCASVCFDYVHDVMHVLPARSIDSISIAISPTDRGGKYDHFRVEPDDLGGTLDRLLAEGPLFTIDEWLESSARSRRDLLVHTSIVQLRRMLYGACGMRMTFPDSAAHIHNAELDGRIRVLQRVAYWWEDRNSLECKIAKKIGLPFSVPLCVDDGVDLVVIIVNDEASRRVRGCFAFPATVLTARSYFSVDGAGRGQTKITVYPPGHKSETAASSCGRRTKHSWQEEFWIDLSEAGNSLFRNRQKFKQILSSAESSGASDLSSPRERSTASPAEKPDAPGQWLSFEEAREWARNLGIRTAKEWRSCRTRPTNVPSNPDVVYRGLYKGIFDWLGKNSSRRRQVTIEMVKKHASRPREEWCSQFAQHDRTLQAFLRLASRYAPTFDFVPTPKHATVDLLFRPNDDIALSTADNENDTYAALHIRSSTHKDKRTRRVVFTRMACARTSGCAIIAHDLLHDNLYVLPPGSVTSGGIYVSASGASGKYDRFRVEDPLDLQSELSRIFDASPLLCKEDWWRTCLIHPRDRVLNNIVGQLTALLYDPCGAGFAYLHENASVHNATFSGGINVLHRMCYRRKYKLMNERYECTLTKMLGGLQVPFDVSDDVDLVVLGVEGDERKLRGCYFFPQDVLVAQSVFSVGHEGGLTAVSLYPPFAIPSIRISEGRRDRIRVMQQWQAEFYVDLTDSCVFEDSRRKFLEILNRVRSSKGM